MLISPIVNEPHHIVINPGKSKKEDKSEVKIEMKKVEEVNDVIDHEDLHKLELELRIDYNNKFKKIENLINESFNKLNDKIDIEISKINVEFDNIDKKIDKKLDPLYDELANYINKLEDLKEEVVENRKQMDDNKKEVNMRDQELTNLIVAYKESILLEVNSNKIEVKKKNDDLVNIMKELRILMCEEEAHIMSLMKRVNILENIPENAGIKDKIPIILGTKRKKLD